MEATGSNEVGVCIHRLSRIAHAADVDQGIIGVTRGGRGGSVADASSRSRSHCPRQFGTPDPIDQRDVDLDKIEAGKLELRAQPLTPAELVRTAVDEIRPLADLFHVQVEQHVEAHRSFEGDRDRVLQVLVNLLSNAVKFSPTDSVVTVSAVAATGAELVNEKGAA